MSTLRRLTVATGAVAAGTVAALLSTAFAPAVAPRATTVAEVSQPRVAERSTAGPTAPGTLQAGVATVDATWHVGAAAGQYSDPRMPQEELSGDVDPSSHHAIKARSNGVQSRLTIRALVLDDGEDRVAMVKSDNYLAQDQLLRRVAAILEEGDSGIGHEDILHAATHNHSSAYYTTPAVGVWIFEDVFDLRMFEYQARRMAAAIEQAADGLAPARLGATTVRHEAYKGNISGPTTADDGSPAGYPRDFGDKGLVVLRVDDLSGDEPAPLATWVNWGQHPESLDGYDLMSADFLGPLERFVDRETGSTLVYSQGDVGSAEGPYAGRGNIRYDDGTLNAWAHVGYAQTERGARLLADSVIEGFEEIGAGGGQVPYRTDLDIEMASRFVSLPYSQPYPGVSNCRSQTTLEGNPGAPVLGLPDCQRADTPTQTDLLVENLEAHGIPVPANLAAPSYGAVEENARLFLQVLQLGDVLLASCACEAQVDLILNLESRLDDVADNQWDGYDWSTYEDGCEVAEDTATCAFPNDEGELSFPAAALDQMLADVHDHPEGWDAPENVVAEAGGEFVGNFTEAELAPDEGYPLVVGVGHAGDYNGYTVSYREFVTRDHYRKALTCCGPHTADYMVTRLLAMTRELRGGEAYGGELHDPALQADEARAVALSTTLGAASSHAFDTWQSALPDDAGAAEVLEQPQGIARFESAEVRWRGGTNAVDNPVARVERRVDGQWVPFADMSGEVATGIEWPQGVQGLGEAHTGSHEWEWFASFEAFTAGPDDDLGGTPVGTYRFVIDGDRREGGATVPYQLTSEPFEVAPWTGIEVADVGLLPGHVSVTVAGPAADAGQALRPRRHADAPLVAYPRTDPDPAFDVIGDDGGTDVCKTCSLRPWAFSGRVESVEAEVVRSDGSVQRVVLWQSPQDPQTFVAAVPGGTTDVTLVRVPVGGVRDTAGNTNGAEVATPVE